MKSCQEMHLRCSKFILLCQSHAPVYTGQYTEWKMLLAVYNTQLAKRFPLLSSATMVHFTDNLHLSSWQVPNPDVAGLAHTKQPLSWMFN